MKELLKHVIFDQRERNLSQMVERDIDQRLVESPEILVAEFNLQMQQNSD